MTPEQDIAIKLAVLQNIVAQGFAGTHDRLDKLNGRVYTGEKEQAALAVRLVVLETRETDRRNPPSNTKIAGWGAGAAATVLALWEFIKPLLASLGSPTP